MTHFRHSTMQDDCGTTCSHSEPEVDQYLQMLQTRPSAAAEVLSPIAA